MYGQCMNIIILFILGIFYRVKCQENAQLKVSNSLLECYNNTYFTIRDNHLPHNIHTFLAILRKIEDSPDLRMNLRELSVALLHRFRQDGIVKNPETKPIPGVTPYASSSDQSPKFVKILQLIPGNALTFPNNSINAMERCMLHFMISSSIDTNDRGDNLSACKLQSSQYRRMRNTKTKQKSDYIRSDVEMLTVEELEKKQSNNNDNTEDDFHPNRFYPILPPNHPKSAQLKSYSKCPLEGGIIETDWGTVSAGPLIAGIAAALEKQNVNVGNLITKNRELLDRVTIDNKWMATLAGDLAEVAIIQGPQDDFKLGINGHWNSSSPKYYFLDNNGSIQFTDIAPKFTAAEVRGDLDGLILASNVEFWYKQVPSLRLSQIIDMYYSDRGIFDSSIKACNRKALLTSVAPNDITTAQAYAASVVLEPSLARDSIQPSALSELATRTVEELFKFIPSSLDNSNTCNVNNNKQTMFNNYLRTDLNIFLDTNWKFSSIQSILTTLLNNAEINSYSSNFTLMNAFNGEIIINSSNSILDFYLNFTENSYLTQKRGLDLPKIIDMLIAKKSQQLNKEWETRIAGGRSDIVIIITPASISDTDKTYCLERLNKMRENIPDVNIFFITTESKEKWSNLVLNPNNDIFIFSNNAEVQTGLVFNMINRFKRVPQRLINSQCGADYSPRGAFESHTDYLQPSGVNFYRLHPNYFYKTDSDAAPTIKVQGANGILFTVCSSRQPLHINTTTSSCSTSESHSIRITCLEASYIHECNPLYLSIAARSINSSTSSLNQCSEPKRCRYPDMMKYTISYENLVCVNSTDLRISSLISVIITIISMYITY